MKIGEIKYGFKLNNIREVKDIDSKVYEFEHIKSGGKVCFFDTNDTNCSFAIGFRTLPKDSTGVCHIIEHSTLCGSTKYPLKEPFVNLLKSSVNSFLNAFTAADWTMYPFASQTKKDYDNIMSVYLDAVFNPLSIKSNKAFLQEGWHLELNNKDEMPIYKGVVYNEMKGAMSSVERVLNQTVLERMYKDTPYRFNSGGDPDVIPSLTYEAYCDFYKTHYTPENALLVMYGKMNVYERLEFIDKEYYSKYSKTGIVDTVVPQEPFKDLDFVKEYEVGDNEPLENNSYIGLAYGLDNYKNFENLLAFQILTDALLSTNESPLKKELLDLNMGEDIDTALDDDNIVPALHIYLEKANSDNKLKFKELFENKVKELVTNGIDKKLLLASINNIEFKMKEMDMGRMPKGIIFAMQIIGDFIYGNDIITHLEFNKYFDIFRKELNNNYFENLLDKYILNSKHTTLVMITPSNTLGKRREENMNKIMVELKAKMSDDEIDKLVKQTADLLEYQNHQDTIDELKCLPSLELKDVSMDVNMLESLADSINDLKGIKHIVNTNGIGYLSVYFDLSCLTYDELKYASMLSVILENVPTANYSVLDLINLDKTYLGDLSFGIGTAPITKDDCKVYFSVSASALAENINHISEIINEIINNSIFTEKEIKQIINQSLIGIKQGIITGGMRAAMDKARSIYSSDAQYSLAIGGGVDKYEFLKELNKDFNIDDFKNKLESISKKIFRRDNLIYSISGLDSEINLLRDEVSKLKLNIENYDEVLKPIGGEANSSCLVIPSGVSYNAMANNIIDLGYSFNGKLAVLTHIIRLDYFWNQIRVKGGAYGSSISINKSGDLVMGSYRDPNVKETYDAFNNISKYLECFNPSEIEFKNYIIGAVGAFDQPESTPSQIRSSDLSFLSHILKKDRVEFKMEAISTTIDDIRGYKDLFNKVNINSNIYAIGNETKLKDFNFNETNEL